MNWWVCRVCDDPEARDKPCFLCTDIVPNRCVNELEQDNWAEWKEATPEDIVEIVAYANSALIKAFKLEKGSS